MAITLYSSAITTPISGAAGQGPVENGLGRVQGATFIARFASTGGGTSCKAFIQTSLDGELWADVASFAFGAAAETRFAAITGASAPPAAITTGSLADNTSVNGLIGAFWRVQVVTTGTFNAGTSLAVLMQAR